MISKEPRKRSKTAAHNTYGQLDDADNPSVNCDHLKKAYEHPEQDEDQFPGHVTVTT